MIIRVFSAKIRKGQVDEFKRLVRAQSIPWLQGSEGMLGYWAGEPLDPGENEFVMITLWRDEQALKKFAGPEWQRPAVTQDEEPLVEEMIAHHYRRLEE